MSPRAHYFLIGFATAVLFYEMYVSKMYGFFSLFALWVILLTHLVEVTYHRGTRLKPIAFVAFATIAVFHLAYVVNGSVKSWSAIFWYFARGAPFLIMVLMPIVPQVETDDEEVAIGL